MENNTKRTCRVKPFFAYFKDSIKFYDIDHVAVPQLVFIIQLAIIFGGYIYSKPYAQNFFIYFEQMSVRLQSQLQSGSYDLSFLSSDTYINLMTSVLWLVLILFVIKTLSYFVGLYYGTYYYLSQTRPELSGMERSTVFFKRLPKLAVFNLLYYILFYAVMIVLLIVVAVITVFMPFFSLIAPVIPIFAVVIDLLFVFKNLLIIEFDTGIIRNFKKSFDITKGCKRNIIVNGLWLLSLALILNAFSVDVGHQLLSLFIASFLEVIVILIRQRLTVLMFIDAASMERVGKPSVKKAE